MKLIRFFILVFLLLNLVSAQSEGQKDTAAVPGVFTDTSSSLNGVSPDTSVSGFNKAQDEQRSLKLTKRSFDHKQQVYWGLGMMAFIAIILSTTQSWNPRN